MSESSARQSTWDRLAQQETVASATIKGKLDFINSKPKTPSSAKKTTNAFFERMSKTETFATADMKGKIDRTPKKKVNDKTTTNSFFDRMSKTDTYASRDMKPNSVKKPKAKPETPKMKKTTDAFFDRMSKTETYATADMKGMIERTPSSVSRSSTASSRLATPMSASRGNKSSKPQLTSNDFFDRMAKTETYASKDMKGLNLIGGNDQKEEVTPRKIGEGKTTTSDFFDRMARSQTASSARKQRARS